MVDRLNDTWFQCIYSFNTLFGLFQQFHRTRARRADIRIFFVGIFRRPRHRNCLRFMLGLINVSINKNKFCQEKSGMNQFWLPPQTSFPPLRESWWFSGAAHSSTLSVSLLTTKTFFKEIGGFSLGRYETTRSANKPTWLGCNHTLQWNTINGESGMRNCEGDQRQPWIQTVRSVLLRLEVH